MNGRRARVGELIEDGTGLPFALAAKVFKEWLSVPKPDRRRWRALLLEGVAFVGGAPAPLDRKRVSSSIKHR